MAGERSSAFRKIWLHGCQADSKPKSRWLRHEGKLVVRGAVPLSVNLTTVSRDLRYRYRLFQRPQGLVERNPVICSVQVVFRGIRIPVAVVVEQLRAGVSRQELEQEHHLSWQSP
jgi:uncharacterized protein (DUF433 family)